MYVCFLFYMYYVCVWYSLYAEWTRHNARLLSYSYYKYRYRYKFKLILMF